MRFSATVRVDPQTRSDVLVDTEPDSTVAELGAALARAVGAPYQGLWLHGARLADDVAVSETRLGEGAEIGLADLPSPPVLPTRGWQLHVVAGQQAGTVWDLPIGAHEIGRSAALQLDDRRVSRVHARLVVTAEGATLSDHSTNGTTLDGQPVGADPVPLRPGQLVALGDSALVVAPARTPDAAVQPGPEGTVEFTR